MEDKLKIYETRYYPLMVSNDGVGVVQTAEEVRSIWKKFDTLPEEKKRLLLSYEVAEKLLLAEKKYNLPEEITGIMTENVRELVFGEIGLEQVEASLGTELKTYIQDQILTLDIPPEIKEVEEEETGVIPEEKVTLRKLQILQALSQYPNLGNQNITTERIRIKSQSEPVRGSLYNWIKCYRDELGIGQHSTVERGQFLFRSENGKRLTPEERERINLILKSIEENYALDIDLEKQVIVFPEMHFEKALAGVSVGAPAVPLKEMFGTGKTEEEMKAPTPNAFFAPRPETEAQSVPQVVVNSFQSGNATVERSAINSILAERQASPVTHDFSREAEKLKREPKPEWIKGAFTKESIPEKVKPEPVNGTMSFSLNHVLPVEQEVKKDEDMKVTPDTQSQVRVLEKQAPVAPASAGSVAPQAPARRNQFHIRPVNRNDF